jgi:hypothetical protein
MGEGTLDEVGRGWLVVVERIPPGSLGWSGVGICLSELLLGFRRWSFRGKVSSGTDLDEK